MKRTNKKEEVAETPIAKPNRRKDIEPLAVDFPNEWLNNMARKLNEVIERINER